VACCLVSINNGWDRSGVDHVDWARRHDRGHAHRDWARYRDSAVDRHHPDTVCRKPRSRLKGWQRQSVKQRVFSWHSLGGKIEEEVQEARCAVKRGVWPYFPPNGLASLCAHTPTENVAVACFGKGWTPDPRPIFKASLKAFK
jgi:hypothetical protein